jgi:hypothetical protein
MWDPYDAVSAGKLFEKVCLWLKPLDGMRFNATSLIDDAPNADFKVPFHREVLPQDWKKTARLVHSVFYVPQISSLDSGECFYLVPLSTSGYLLMVLQFTMGMSHPVKANGLHDILFAYSGDVRVQVVSKALVFVLPARGELQQKGKRVEDSSCVPVAVRDFKQYMYRHEII